MIESLKDRIVTKLKESTQIVPPMPVDLDDLDDLDKGLEDAKHPNKQSEKEKKNLVLFFQEIAKSNEQLISEDVDTHENTVAHQLKNIACYSINNIGLAESMSELPTWIQEKLDLAEENMIMLYNFMNNES